MSRLVGLIDLRSLTPFQIANLIECVFWVVIGLVLLIAAVWTSPRLRRYPLWAVPALIMFGFSDAVESQTGAWWRPWWLLAWKGTCIVVLAGLLVAYYRNRNSRG